MIVAYHTQANKWFRRKVALLWLVKMLGKSSNSSMNSIFDSKESVLPYSKWSDVSIHSSFPCIDHMETNLCRLYFPVFLVQLAEGSIGKGLRRRRKGEPRGPPSSSLCFTGCLSSCCISSMTPASTRCAHHGCWVTQLLTLLTPLLPLSPQPKGLGASCSCWFLDSFTSLCLASQNFHQLCNQFL